MQLKLKDKKLLLELFRNSKQSNREIAKKIGIAKETVANRIDFFKSNNYIKDFSTKINYEKLDFNEYNLFIRLKNITDTKINNLINFLEKLPHTTWIGKAFGKYDLKIAIIINQNQHSINELITQISQKFSTSIDIIDYLYVTDKYKASSKMFLKNLIELDATTIPKTKIKESDFLPDKLDKELIYELGQNPKIPYTLLAQKFNLTAEAIKHRIKRLEKNNIITGYSIVFNGNKFNKIWCLVLLNFNIEKLEDFKTYLKTLPFLSSYNETLGIWNFNVTFFANNIEELYTNINKIRTKYSTDIKMQEFLIFFEIYKYPKIPKCIKE